MFWRKNKDKTDSKEEQGNDFDVTLMDSWKNGAPPPLKAPVVTPLKPYVPSTTTTPTIPKKMNPPLGYKLPPTPFQPKKDESLLTPTKKHEPKHPAKLPTAPAGYKPPLPGNLEADRKQKAKIVDEDSYYDNQSTDDEDYYDTEESGDEKTPPKVPPKKIANRPKVPPKTKGLTHPIPFKPIMPRSAKPSDKSNGEVPTKGFVPVPPKDTKPLVRDEIITPPPVPPKIPSKIVRNKFLTPIPDLPEKDKRDPKDVKNFRLSGPQKQNKTIGLDYQREAGKIGLTPLPNEPRLEVFDSFKLKLEDVGPAPIVPPKVPSRLHRKKILKPIPTLPVKVDKDVPPKVPPKTPRVGTPKEKVKNFEEMDASPYKIKHEPKPPSQITEKHSRLTRAAPSPFPSKNKNKNDLTRRTNITPRTKASTLYNKKKNTQKQLIPMPNELPERSLEPKETLTSTPKSRAKGKGRLERKVSLQSFYSETEAETVVKRKVKRKKRKSGKVKVRRRRKKGDKAKSVEDDSIADQRPPIPPLHGTGTPVILPATAIPERNNLESLQSNDF